MISKKTMGLGLLLAAASFSVSAKLSNEFNATRASGLDRIDTSLFSDDATPAAKPAVKSAAETKAANVAKNNAAQAKNIAKKAKSAAKAAIPAAASLTKLTVPQANKLLAITEIKAVKDVDKWCMVVKANKATGVKGMTVPYPAELQTNLKAKPTNSAIIASYSRWSAGVKAAVTKILAS